MTTHVGQYATGWRSTGATSLFGLLCGYVLVEMTFNPIGVWVISSAVVMIGCAFLAGVAGRTLVIRAARRLGEFVPSEDRELAVRVLLFPFTVASRIVLFLVFLVLIWGPFLPYFLVIFFYSFWVVLGLLGVPFDD